VLLLLLLLVPTQFWVVIVELLLIFKITSAAIATELGIFWIPALSAVLIVVFEFAFGAKHSLATDASAVFCFFFELEHCNTLRVSAFYASAPGTGSNAAKVGETYKIIRLISNEGSLSSIT
jgi:hypothetical protein